MDIKGRRGDVYPLKSLSVGNLLGLVQSPESSLHESSEHTEQTSSNDGLGSGLLSEVLLGRSSPGKEDRHVLGHLTDGGGGSVLVLDLAVRERLLHRDGVTGEVGVVVESVSQLETSRGVMVSSQDGEYVVFGIVTRGHHERKIRRSGSTVSKTGGLFVRVGLRESVEYFTSTGKHFSLVVGPICGVYRGSQSLSLVLGVRNSDELSVRTVFQRVTSGANVTVNFETSTNGGGVEGGEESGVVPVLVRSVRNIGRGETRLAVGDGQGGTTHSGYGEPDGFGEHFDLCGGERREGWRTVLGREAAEGEGMARRLQQEQRKEKKEKKKTNKKQHEAEAREKSTRYGTNSPITVWIIRFNFVL